MIKFLKDMNSVFKKVIFKFAGNIYIIKFAGII